MQRRMIEQLQQSIRHRSTDDDDYPRYSASPPRTTSSVIHSKQGLPRQVSEPGRRSFEYVSPYHPPKNLPHMRSLDAATNYEVNNNIDSDDKDIVINFDELSVDTPEYPKYQKQPSTNSDKDNTTMNIPRTYLVNDNFNEKTRPVSLKLDDGINDQLSYRRNRNDDNFLKNQGPLLAPKTQINEAFSPTQEAAPKRKNYIPPYYAHIASPRSDTAPVALQQDSGIVANSERELVIADLDERKVTSPSSNVVFQSRRQITNQSSVPKSEPGNSPKSVGLNQVRNDTTWQSSVTPRPYGIKSPQGQEPLIAKSSTLFQENSYIEKETGNLLKTEKKIIYRSRTLSGEGAPDNNEPVEPTYPEQSFNKHTPTQSDTGSYVYYKSSLSPRQLKNTSTLETDQKLTPVVQVLDKSPTYGGNVPWRKKREPRSSKPNIGATSSGEVANESIQSNLNRNHQYHGNDHNSGTTYSPANDLIIIEETSGSGTQQDRSPASHAEPIGDISSRPSARDLNSKQNDGQVQLGDFIRPAEDRPLFAGRSPPPVPLHTPVTPKLSNSLDDFAPLNQRRQDGLGGLHYVPMVKAQPYLPVHRTSSSPKASNQSTLANSENDGRPTNSHVKKSSSFQSGSYDTNENSAHPLPGNRNVIFRSRNARN